MRSTSGFNTLLVRLLVVPVQGTSRCIASVDPGANGYRWGQIYKPRRQVACERLYTPQGVEMDIQRYLCNVKARWPGKVLVCRAEPWAWMWTLSSDFTFFYTLNNVSEIIMPLCHCHKKAHIHQMVAHHFYSFNIQWNYIWHVITSIIKRDL